MTDIDNILDKAYSLYMPQHKDEIKALALFVHQLNPKIVVEIGTKFGGTFMIWNEVTNARTISVDLVEGIHGGVTRESTDKRNLNFKDWYGDKCSFIEGNSHDQSTYDALFKHLNGNQIDFLFIDGDHTYEGVKQDYEMYSKLVRTDGYIAFHDINNTAYHISRDVHVDKLWNELEHEKIEFNVKGEWGGIGVIKK